MLYLHNVELLWLLCRHLFLAVAVSDPLVTAYRFEISDGNTVRTYTTSDGATNYFKLNQLSGFPIIQLTLFRSSC